MTVLFKSIASWTLLLLILIQFIHLNRSNPPAFINSPAPDQIKNALKKSCYDCHSNETRWTGITYMAPVSWWLSGMVASGRTALNFSTSNRYKNKAKIRKVISENASHYQLYYIWEPDAQLTVTETGQLMKWLK
jgi:hypothetical protein